MKYSKQYIFHNNFPVMVKIKNLPVTVLPLASVTTTVSTVVGTVAVTGLPLASIGNMFIDFRFNNDHICP